MEGVTGDSYTSDVAIDNIAFRNGSCERLGMYEYIYHCIFEISQYANTETWIKLIRLIANDICNIFSVFSSYPVVIRLHKGRWYRLQIGQKSSSQWMGLSVYSACFSNKKHFNRCDVLCVPSKHCPLCKRRHPRAFIRWPQLLSSRLLLFLKDISATLQKDIASEPGRKTTIRDCLGGIPQLLPWNSYRVLLCKCVIRP